MLNIFEERKVGTKKKIAIESKFIWFYKKRGEEKLQKIILYLVAKESFLVYFSCIFLFCVKEFFFIVEVLMETIWITAKTRVGKMKNTEYVFIVNLQVYILVGALNGKLWLYIAWKWSFYTFPCKV